MQKMRDFVFPSVGYLFLVLMPTWLGITTANNISTDQYALLAFKNHVMASDTHHQILSRNWSASASVCKWIGVTCGSRHHRVTALNVSYMGLSGTIPPHLGNLSFLTSLDMAGNSFHGELPNALSDLRRLKALNFSINNLSGEIPSWIGSLHELKFLYLRNNTFTGPIPDSISNVSKLEQLSLSFNSLQLSFPKGIGNLHKLKKLAIDYNQISGPIPHEVFNISSLEIISLLGNALYGSLPMSMCNCLKKLKWLNLSFNKLNGEIPSGLSQCSQLQVLSLSINEFGGFIPKEIGNLKLLEELYLGNNNLKGEIPREIGNLTMLKLLALSDSNLSGVIPREFGNLYNFEILDLLNASLSGSIPLELFNLSSMIALQLGFNNLSGNLPSNICVNPPNLEHLHLYVNNLNGVLPESISNCSSLKLIAFGRNKFVGSIPTSLGNLGSLEVLDLSKNHLTSHFPTSSEHGLLNSLTKCKYLRLLFVDNNSLGGYLPNSVGNLSTSLERFYGYNCNIKGKIPLGFGNLSSLFELSLSGNKLTGSLPETLKDLQLLQALDLGNNELNGAMLDKVCGLPNLFILSLSQNHVSEPIPECLGNVASLGHLYLDSNRLTSTIPTSLSNLKDLLELNLSSNSLGGSLPPEIGHLKAAIMMDFSVNNLSSGIPGTIGDLKDLEYFSLAFNKFQGLIPESVSGMISLLTLDLSHNHLSGIIPPALEKLRYLKYFNVSFNDLSGEIPLHGPFESFTSESFTFNKALCGAQRFNVPPCPKSSRHKVMRSKMVLIVLAILLGLAAFFCAIAFICIRCIGKGIFPVPRIDSSSAALQERFSYYNLEFATNGFNDSNLLGKGSFGSVYKATMRGGRIFAVKVFNADIQAAFKSFDRECKVLRNLRHRNLIKVISNCSTPDFKALILEFMSNGSLEKWLYSYNYCLDIMQRLSIMIDVACALEYLHGGYLTPVVHCDLKPSNILLDEDMVAHVTDFGISKFLEQEDSITYTETVATFGYTAPEYGFEGLVSPKCDVYSYGILMMEVFTRTNPIDEMFGGDFNLRRWVSDSMPNGLAEVIDANVLSTDEAYFNHQMECFHSIMEVALNCTKESPRERSSIADAHVALDKIKLQLLSYSRGEAGRGL